MLNAIDNRSHEHNARDWFLTLFGRVGLSPSTVSEIEHGESKPQPPWKQFDDTHHWDSTAEEWIPNDPT